MIYDDNKGRQEALALLLSNTTDMKFVGGKENCNEVEEDMIAFEPDVVLMDIDMPGVNGIDGLKIIRKTAPTVYVIMQTVFEDDDRVFDSICAGASGYILKNFLNTKLVDSINELQYGGSPMSPSIARKVLNKMQSVSSVIKPEETPDYHLTAREKEVLSCLVNGLSYKMIGAELNISYETVRSHVKKIYEKLHVASLTEVVAKAIHQRIV